MATEGAQARRIFQPTVPIYLAMAVWTAVYAPVAILPMLLALALPARVSGGMMRHIALWYGILMVRVAWWPFVRVRYENRVEDGDAPGIYLFNHRSGSDPFLMACLGLPLIQAVNGWPMRLPLLGFVARKAEYIDVTRTTFPATLATVTRLLASGVSIASFPEGHRSGSCSLRSFHSGIFRIATELSAPVYLCGIAGNEDLPDRQFRFRRRGTILVRKFRKLSPEQVAEYSSHFALKAYAHQAIAHETASMDQEIANAI